MSYYHLSIMIICKLLLLAQQGESQRELYKEKKKELYDSSIALIYMIYYTIVYCFRILERCPAPIC